MRRVLATVLLLAGACGAPGFTERFAQVEAGASRARLTRLLGPPDAQRTATVPEGPFWGPCEGLSKLLGAGAPYEEWFWSRDGLDHYVWLAPQGAAVPAGWTVVDKAAYPPDAVFESSG